MVRTGSRDLGEKLGGQADTEQRRAPFERVPQQRLLGPKPRMLFLVVDVHRATERHHRVEPVELGRRAVLGRHPIDPLDAGNLAEDAGAGVVVDDDGEDPHSGVR